MEPPIYVDENAKEVDALVGDHDEGIRAEIKHKSGINTLVVSVVGVIYVVLLVFSARYFLEFERKAIGDETQNENDVRVAEAAQLIEKVPGCMTSCIFPLIPQTCTHMDYRCICTNLRSLDDPPPLPPEDIQERYDSSLPYPYTSEFATCVNDTCNLLEQIRAPGHIYNLCHIFGVTVDFPEVMVSFYKLSGLDTRDISAVSGSTFFQPSSISIVESSTQISTVSLPPITTTSLPKTETTSHADTSSASLVNTFSSFQTSSITSISGPATTTITGDGGNKKSGGLSSGAKIGIGVSIPLAVVIFLAGAFWYFRKMRAKRTSTGIPGDINTIPEKYSEMRPVIEADGSHISEMGHTTSGTRADIYEMPSQTTSSPASVSRKPITRRAELAGDKASKTSPVLPPGSNYGGRNDTVGLNSNSNSPPDPIVLPIASTSSSAPPPQKSGTVTETTGDAELVRLETEMAQVQHKKRRLQEEKELERREEELQRIIEERRKVIGTRDKSGESS